ncbi:MAG: late competence development ComFB family protein [Gemmatimonadaceae bacterium]|nr:late competence development ComFB family protein [Gloeobacterales cyanobacterium ES-bin-141]
MRFLAVVERKRLIGHQQVRLLSKEADEHTWVPARGELGSELANRFGPGTIVIAHITANQRLQRLEEATEQLVSLLHGLSDYVRECKLTMANVESWKQSLAFQSEQLRSREAELTMRTQEVSLSAAPVHRGLPSAGQSTASNRSGLPAHPAPEATGRRKHHLNVMETLVAREFDVQIARLPSQAQARVDRTDAESWSLNRLPAYYATGKRGMQMLEARLLEEHHSEIIIAIRGGIETVFRNNQPPGEPCLPGDDTGINWGD